MNDILVVYFSATGVTEKVAKRIVNVTDGFLYEIKPKIPYSKADLDWMNKESRSSLEMSNKSYRPEIEDVMLDVDKYKIVLLGFPIWWYVAPTIVNTFLESVDLNGKVIIPFVTSGSSGLGNTVDELKLSASGANILDGIRFSESVTDEEIKKWLNECGII